MPPGLLPQRAFRAAGDIPVSNAFPSLMTAIFQVSSLLTDMGQPRPDPEIHGRKAAASWRPGTLHLDD
jgi:hypothetical protein